jgi:hypothetical protein
MPTVEFNDINHSGLTAQITFNSWTGGSSSLGSHTIPYVYSSQYPYGTYNFNYSPWNQDCSILVPPPCDINISRPRINYYFCVPYSGGSVFLQSGSTIIFNDFEVPINASGGFNASNTDLIRFYVNPNPDNLSTEYRIMYVLNETLNTYLVYYTGYSWDYSFYNDLIFFPESNYVYSIRYYTLPVSGQIDVVQISGCPNRVFTYSVSNADNASSIYWTVPAGATIISGQGTISISVSYPGTIINSEVTISTYNSCGLPGIVKTVIVRLASCPGP